MRIVSEIAGVVQPEGSLWTVLGRAFYVRHGNKSIPHVVCLCDCGTVGVVSVYNLRSGGCKSCGCFRKARLGRHFQSGTRLHSIWLGMLDRCRRANRDDFFRYGGRGIRVCDEWQSFEAFRDWANANGYADNLTIEREDANGNYEPSNCRWATMKAQANNTRRSVVIEAFGESKTAAQWLEDSRCVAGRGTLTRRIRAGMQAELAITTPAGK